MIPIVIICLVIAVPFSFFIGLALGENDTQAASSLLCISAVVQIIACVMFSWLRTL